mgnify:CR=1 FL=1
MSLILGMTIGMEQMTDAYTIDKGYISLKADSFKSIGNIKNDGIKTDTATGEIKINTRAVSQTQLNEISNKIQTATSMPLKIVKKADNSLAITYNDNDITNTMELVYNGNFNMKNKANDAYTNASGNQVIKMYSDAGKEIEIPYMESLQISNTQYDENLIIDNGQNIIATDDVIPTGRQELIHKKIANISQLIGKQVFAVGIATDATGNLQMPNMLGTVKSDYSIEGTIDGDLTYTNFLLKTLKNGEESSWNVFNEDISSLEKYKKYAPHADKESTDGKSNAMPIILEDNELITQMANAKTEADRITILKQKYPIIAEIIESIDLTKRHQSYPALIILPTKGELDADRDIILGTEIKGKSKVTCQKDSGLASLEISEGSQYNVTKGRLYVREYIRTDKTSSFKGKVFKQFAAANQNTMEGSLHIAGNINLQNKKIQVQEATSMDNPINKGQIDTALDTAKTQQEKLQTYYAGTGIHLDTNNTMELTNAAAYATNNNNRVFLAGTAKTNLKKIKAGKITETSKDLVNGAELNTIQQSIAGFADRIQTNKNQLEALKSSINSKKEDLSSIQKNLNTIKETKLSQDMSNLTTDGEAVIKNQVKKAIQKFQKDLDESTIQTNMQETKVSGAMEAKSTESYKPSIMLADEPIEAANEPVNAVSAISKEDVAAKAGLSQTKINLEKKATLDTMNVSAYTKQVSKGLATGESAYHALQEAKGNRLVQTKGNTLTVGANGAETKIDASKKNWTGIIVDEKEAGSLANVGYVDQTLSMESSYDKLSLMKKDLEKDTNKGIAKAAALAALKPIGHDEEDKVSFAIGYGHYKDGNAAAIGTFYRPNQDILIHLDITAGAGKPGMNTGVSFKVGKGSSYASMTREELAEENAAMKNQAEKQAERIHTQKEKIEHLESVMQSIRF